jgi:hypothetical protein
MEEIKNLPVGEVRIIAHRPGGKFNPQTQQYEGAEVLSDTKEYIHNMIVNKASVFMAKRMYSGASWGAGIGYLAVGIGYGTGTIQVPQPEDATYVKLRNELARKAIQTCQYIDASGNIAGAGVETNIVQYITTFLTSEANGAIVEMGLFGGDASATKDSGYMFNYKAIPVWMKTSDIELTVAWKITY